MASKFPKSLGAPLAEITVPLGGEWGWLRLSYDYETPSNITHRAFFSVVVYQESMHEWPRLKILTFIQTPHFSRAIEIAEEYGTLSADHLKQITEFGRECPLALFAAKIAGVGVADE